MIGEPCKDIAASEALEHVAGYTLLNDLSARDYQFKTPQWMPGKAFDGSAPFGPALVTTDEAGPHDAIGIALDLNGERMQESSTADLVHSIPALVEYLSMLMTLEPGDVVATGTPVRRRQPARPEGVAEAGRRGGGQLSAAGGARTTLAASRARRSCQSAKAAAATSASISTAAQPTPDASASSKVAPRVAFGLFAAGTPARHRQAEGRAGQRAAPSRSSLAGRPAAPPSPVPTRPSAPISSQ